MKEFLKGEIPIWESYENTIKRFHVKMSARSDYTKHDVFPPNLSFCILKKLTGYNKSHLNYSLEISLSIFFINYIYPFHLKIN